MGLFFASDSITHSLNSHLRIFALYTKKMCLGSLQILGSPPLAHRGLSLSASPAGLLSHYGHHSTTQTSISSRQIEKVSSFCWAPQYFLNNDFSLKFLIVLRLWSPKNLSHYDLVIIFNGRASSVLTLNLKVQLLLMATSSRQLTFRESIQALIYLGCHKCEQNILK